MRVVDNFPPIASLTTGRWGACSGIGGALTRAITPEEPNMEPALQHSGDEASGTSEICTTLNELDRLKTVEGFSLQLFITNRVHCD
jgi:hypothetical protein